MAEPQHADNAPPRIAITGSTGLIGGRLASFLAGRGLQVAPIIRREPRPGTGEIRWDPARGEIDAAVLEHVDAVVHLAGENIGAKRWTPARKQVILRSRTDSTRLLCETLARLANPPRVLISGSAIGYYGNRGDEILDEQSPAGDGFLPDLCRQWEAATEPARDADIRVVLLRTGVVLAAEGGALTRMLTPFRLCLGGRVGTGRQYMSWIALDDLVRAIHHLIFVAKLSGPVNAVAPNHVTNAEFTATLGKVLRRPTVLPLPAFMVRRLFGEMGQALLLDGARVLPGKLQDSGFVFLYPDLQAALRHELSHARS